ncbi:hypothetical protein V2J09_010615 [Rumex salicifolius]
MGRAPCCDKANVKKGPWSPEEDAQLKDYIHSQGTGGNWIALPQKAGLKRCGKSCRLRWLNYLRPNIKHGEFTEEEDSIICSLFANIGSRWSIIAAQLPGRTDNDIKNYWNTKLKKKLMMGMANNNTISSKSQMSNHKEIKPNTAYKNPMLSSSSSSSSPPPYNTSLANYYNAPSSALSFTGFDHPTLMGNSSNSLCTSASTFLHSNYLAFGGAQEPSCSSSDGSYNNNKYSYNLYNGASVVEDQDQKTVFSSGFLGKTQNGDSSWVWEETAPLMDSGLEEIKQLINTNTSAIITAPNNGDFGYCSGFGFDENKTGERAMLFAGSSNL